MITIVQLSLCSSALKRRKKLSDKQWANWFPCAKCIIGDTKIKDILLSTLIIIISVNFPAICRDIPCTFQTPPGLELEEVCSRSWSPVNIWSLHWWGHFYTMRLATIPSLCSSHSLSKPAISISHVRYYRLFLHSLNCCKNNALSVH